jgi:hypothetical protein
MTMSYDDWAYDQYMAEVGHEEELRRAIDDISIDNASWYLGTFGDALEKRVRTLMDEAKVLDQSGHPGPSLILSVSALELVIRYFVLKPLVSGAFINDLWADLLVDKLVTGNAWKDRELLPLIACEWSIDLDNIVLNNGEKAWDLFKSRLVPRRNNFVHKGDPVAPEISLVAVECTNALFEGLLGSIARKFQLSWPESGAWHRVAQGVGAGQHYTDYSPQDPFS